jgi:hypothetical protein
VLKLVCPACLKSVAVPDEAAGQETPCPECGKPFPVPARYHPVVAPARVAPPSDPAPSHALPIPQLQAAPPATALLAGYTRSRGLTIAPGAVAWLPAVCLTLIVLLTFTPWVGVYLKGHAIYSQGAWRAITGNPQRDIALEEYLLKDVPPPSISDRTRSDWPIMLPYILAVLLACGLAGAERLQGERISAGISRLVPTIWPHRHSVIAALAGAALLLLAIEAARGFGLERAVEEAVSEKFEAARSAAATPGELAKVEFYQNQELAKYGLEHTGWFCAVLGLHVLALLALLGRVGLERRGNKPPPRLVIQY